VAVTEGPDTIGALVRQRARWQRVINETVWHYRRMLLNPRYGTVGTVGMVYYLAAEVLAPVFQAIGILTVPLAAIGGVLGWSELWRMVAILSFAAGLFTNLALLVQENNNRRFSAGDLPYLILVTPLDLLLYRPLIFYAQFKGMIGFFRGERGWDKFARNRRDDLATPDATEPAV
jgi:hypothetical protein